MSRRFLALALLAPIVASCAAKPTPRPVVTSEEAPPELEWQRLATAADEAQIAALPDRLAHVRQAASRRYRTKITAEGKLVEPAAEPMPQLPPGPYHCRLLRFGGTRGFVTYPPDLCYVTVAPEGLAFTKASGENLPQGYLYPAGDARQVFIGTLGGADPTTKHAYGDNPANDIVGIVERVSSFRWRLILSRAGKGAALDLYELVPVPPQVPGAKPAVPSD